MGNQLYKLFNLMMMNLMVMKLWFFPEMIPHIPIFWVSFISSMFLLLMNTKHVFNTLIFLEFLMINCLLFTCFLVNYFNYNYQLLFLMLTFSVCGASFGLGLLVNFTRMKGNSMLTST